MLQKISKEISVPLAFFLFVVLMPFGAFFFRRMDLWNGQGMYFQTGLLIIFCLSLFQAPQKVNISNLPLFLFTLWASLTTCTIWYSVAAETGQYPIKVFLSFFNFLCFIFFYKLSLEYLNKELIEKILKWLSYSVIALMFYCILQFFNLDEFFHSLNVVEPDCFVGTIGNQSHLGGYLALCQPLFFEKKMFNYLALALLWVCILITQSLSAIVCGVGVLLFWLFFKKKYLYSLIVLILTIIGGIGASLLTNFYSFQGRWLIWKEAYKYFQDKAILGYGLGTWASFKFYLKGNWRAAHQEYYQLAIELGIIGLVLALWCIWEYFRGFKHLKTNLTIRLASIFFGFCLLGFFTFPVHLWSLSFLGMMSYSWLYVVKNGGL